jgi:UDP-N-acetylglucosamine 4,6-dehydratase
MITPAPLDHLESARILITGGTGSLGKKLLSILLRETKSSVIAIYSRDELKQYELGHTLSVEDRARVRFFLGDVRDEARLRRALHNVDYVIHAAALKHVPAAEYNPFEFIKTNVVGAENIINACLDTGVKRVVALSTDKAANPINLYGATKLCSDKLFVAGNSYAGSTSTRFSVVRYGNVVGSRGSVVPFFLEKRKTGMLPITDLRMTRFWITLDQGARLVLNALREMRGGEIFVPKIPSMRVVDLARLIAPECKWQEIGIRPGEKLHEVMIPVDDARSARNHGTHFIIEPGTQSWAQDATRRDGTPCPPEFSYASDTNTQWVTDEEMSKMILELNLPSAREWAAERGLLPN